MDVQGVAVTSIGEYRGIVSPGYDSAGCIEQLARMGDLLSGNAGTVLHAGRNRLARLVLQQADHTLPVAVKSFGRRLAVQDWIDGRKGSRAHRSWLAARFLQEHGVGTPRPIAFLDRWQDGRLLESHYIAEYAESVTSFKEELIRIFREDPRGEPLMDLIRRVAAAVRAMHDTGLQHNDLGNQNILLRGDGGHASGDVLFVDLNRSRHGEPLGERARARDISRIWLPSDFLRAFKDMYFDGPVPPRSFQRWEAAYRGQYALHAATRKLRHPARRGRGEEKTAQYPLMKDIWIWDERSGQALIIMQGKQKRHHYPLRRHAAQLCSAIDIARVLPEYRRLRRDCFQNRVHMKGRLGLAVDLRPENWQRQQAVLERMGRIPLLVRFCAHRERAQHEFAAKAVRALHERGHPISLSLLQDRQAVRDPARWREFLERVLGEIGSCVDEVEAGHAINRVKWGIWHFDEYRRLIEATSAVLDGYPQIGLMGPATIDFDPLSTAAGLRCLPLGTRLSALSLHLYVDRRGAPENAQGPFTALEKFAWNRAVARCAKQCSDRLVVSEVNWPLKGTGIYSPVGAPYTSPGVRRNDPSVSEDDYADYMLRYLLMAATSGMVDRVYWWRLVARGYGLIDDTEPGAWRERPAYRALVQLVRTLGDATFVRRDEAECPMLHFEGGDGERIAVTYATSGEGRVPLTFDCDWIEDAQGRPLRPDGDSIHVGGGAVYIRGLKDSGESASRVPPQGKTMRSGE